MSSKDQSIQQSLSLSDDEFERIKYQFILVVFIIFVMLTKCEEFIYGKKADINTDQVIEHKIEGFINPKYNDVVKTLESFFTSGTDVHS